MHNAIMACVRFFTGFSQLPDRIDTRASTRSWAWYWTLLWSCCQSIVSLTYRPCPCLPPPS